MKKYKVTKKATRPAGDDDRCFYCNKKIGDYHKKDCVLISKKAKVIATIEYEVDVPFTWKKHDIEFNRNDGTWCASNIINELKELDKKEGCLCQYIEYECIDDKGKSFLDE